MWQLLRMFFLIIDNWGWKIMNKKNQIWDGGLQIRAAHSFITLWILSCLAGLRMVFSSRLFFSPSSFHYLFLLSLKPIHQSHGPVEAISSRLLSHTSSLLVPSITPSVSTSLHAWSIFIRLAAFLPRLSSVFYCFCLVPGLLHHLPQMLTSWNSIYPPYYALFL